MAFLLASIPCPRCSTRLLWDVFRHPDGLNALVDLLKARSCPKCGYTPHGAGD
jgi:DNA-directed RNA polymerase subunit RPC12/RpoP